jgi:hypothetical protein
MSSLEERKGLVLLNVMICMQGYSQRSRERLMSTDLALEPESLA